MFAVFDVIRNVGIDKVVSEIKVLKLVRGGEILVSVFSLMQLLIDYSLTSTIKEQVEFPDLQDQVRMDEDRALSQKIPDPHLRVIVIVKRPLLALRYMLPDGQIRKTQMNFVPFSGCDVALETLRAAGLPIRNRDLPQLQDQRPQSAPSQSRSQKRPGSLNAGQVELSQSSQGAIPGSSQPFSQEIARVVDAGYTSILSALQPTKVDARPTSAPGGVNQDEFSRPISTSSKPSLDAFRSTSGVTTAPTVAKPGPRSGLLPSPVFNGKYEPFGSVEVRPTSAPEPTQTQRDYANSPTVSQMLPPERTLPFAEKKVHPFRREEVSSQEDTSEQRPAPKMIVKLRTKPRAQQAKSTKPRAKRRATNISSSQITPSSPSRESREKGKAPSSSAPPKVRAKSTAFPDDVTPSVVQAIPQPSRSRKRSLTDGSVDQPNKRQAQSGDDTTRDDSPEDLTTADPEQPLPEQPTQGTDPRYIIRNQNLLDTIDNHIRKYHDLPAPKPPPQTAKEQLAEYAAQSEEDRARALDNMICACLEDDDFGTLMEDIEKAWKRIGMGL